MATIIDGVGKAAEATVTAVYPKYYLGNSASSMTVAILDAAITAGTGKQGIANAVSGSASVVTTSGQYLWLCVPSPWKVTKVTSGGFDVPMQAVQAVTSTSKGAYNCYRSAEAFAAGTGSFAITGTLS